jgi:hypothetical protein
MRRRASNARHQPSGLIGIDSTSTRVLAEFDELSRGRFRNFALGVATRRVLDVSELRGSGYRDAIEASRSRSIETYLQPASKSRLEIGDSIDRKLSICEIPDLETLPFQLADSADESNNGMDYHMEIIDKDDKLRVLKFLRRFFFRDEPLNQCIQLIPEGEDSTCEELEDYCSNASFENNLSLMAISASGTIVGVSLNGKTATLHY